MTTEFNIGEKVFFIYQDRFNMGTIKEIHSTLSGDCTHINTNYVVEPINSTNRITLYESRIHRTVQQLVKYHIDDFNFLADAFGYNLEHIDLDLGDEEE